MKETIYFSGLPRSGSTLLCNLLAQHPDVTSTPSSPLCSIVKNIKRIWSDDPFLLAQLDHDFNCVYEKLRKSIRSFMDTWSDNKTKITIDKNRGWLQSVELLRAIYPDFKMIISIRDLRAIYASIETQHINTILLEFPDHLESDLVDARASIMFANGMLGSCLKYMQNIQDIEGIMSHFYFVRYEDFFNNPSEIMKGIIDWIGLDEFKFDFNNITQYTHESDSYYRFKYPHKINKKITLPKHKLISPRISNTILTQFNWFYKNYYPNIFNNNTSLENAKTDQEVELNNIEQRISQEVEEAIRCIGSSNTKK